MAEEFDAWGRQLDPSTIRWFELALVSVIWAAAAAGTGSPLSVVAGALLVGHLAALPVSLRLPVVDRSVRHTATARRVVLSTTLALTAALSWQFVGGWQPGIVRLLLSIVVTWLALAVSTRIAPLAQSGGVAPKALSWLPASTTPVLAMRAKRVFDVVVGSALLIAVSPVLLVTAVAIRRHDGGPVFFRQERLGRNDVPFRMLKFRSMVVDAEARKAALRAENDRSGPLFKMSNDPRITPIGAVIREFSIDELPQLVNVVRGDMSLIGPRPALPDEAAEFDPTLARRTIVTPGLTGLWQAEARNDADFGRFRELDLRYVATASPILDLWILAATATEVVSAAASVPLRRLGVAAPTVDGIIDLRSTDPQQVTIDLRSTNSTPEVA